MNGKIKHLVQNVAILGHYEVSRFKETFTKESFIDIKVCSAFPKGCYVEMNLQKSTLKGVI